MWYFYPRPPQGGRPGQAPASVCGRMISIHALRKEGDTATAPRTRRSWYFYPRPPQGGRRGKAGNQYRHHAISIHALRKEGDRECIRTINAYVLFLSTPSARRATSDVLQLRTSDLISIHALREEGDPAQAQDPAGGLYFYPRPPRGGRLDGLHRAVNNMAFLSTPSARRATSLDFFTA